MRKIFLLIFLLSISFPAIALASFDISLKYGSRGNAVSQLQDFLQNQGDYSGKVDGWFGLGTLKAVKAFQSTNGLSVDGYFGKASRAKANNILATVLQSSNKAKKVESSETLNTDSNGCSATSLFSVTTGLSCTKNRSFPDGCTQTSMYSSTTGKLCTNTTYDSNVSIPSIQSQNGSVGSKVLGQITQSAQTVAQNTCIPNWRCNNWSNCVDGEQTGICTDFNNCGTNTNKPASVRACTLPSVVINSAGFSPNYVVTGLMNTMVAVFAITNSGGDNIKVNSLQIAPKITDASAGKNCVTNTLGFPTGICGLKNISLYLNDLLIGSSKDWSGDWKNWDGNWPGGTLTYQFGLPIIIPGGKTSYLKINADLNTLENIPYSKGQISITLPMGINNAQDSIYESSMGIPQKDIYSSTILK